MTTMTEHTTDAPKADWSELKGKIKSRFSKLTDDSIDSMKGNLALLADKLQAVYGYGKDQAERELAGFKATLHSATAPAAKPN